MSNSNLENSVAFTDKLKFFLSVLLFLSAFISFSFLNNRSFYERLLVFVFLIVLSGTLFIFSKLGRSLLYFIKDSFFELKLMSWPQRKEAVRMTVVVFVFAFSVSLFILFIDKCIEYLLYVLFLGWK
ncbi:MAG: preprotein translocase subunit SecE [Candidatus Kinetoplastibacterium crithidii]|nr:MAG: preprotein translocase subunit SecE [Candidatus Kinetoplastibacterium crithidii]